MKKRLIGLFVFMLLVATFILPASGKVNFSKTEIEQQPLVDTLEVAVTTGDDVEIYIYAGNKTNSPVGSSYGFQVNIKVINHLSEAIWVYLQEDYFSLFSSKPISAFQWRNQFVAPPHETKIIEIHGGVPFPCRYRLTVQAYVFEYVSRSGFQFRRFTFFPGEK